MHTHAACLPPSSLRPAVRPSADAFHVQSLSCPSVTVHTSIISGNTPPPYIGRLGSRVPDTSSSCHVLHQDELSQGSSPLMLLATLAPLTLGAAITGYLLHSQTCRRASAPGFLTHTLLHTPHFRIQGEGF